MSRAEALVLDVGPGNHLQQVSVANENIPYLDGLHLEIWIVQRLPHLQRGTRNVVQNVSVTHWILRDSDRLSIHIQCADNNPLSAYQTVRIQRFKGGAKTDVDVPKRCIEVVPEAGCKW